jgi:hypothetical protein
MGELSFLTIIVSLAVCSLLVYAIFQYMKVRLTILEQSHKEQALILQQFIEESSTDIHRLYQMKSSASHNNDNAAQYGGGHHGSIILEYANANADANDTSEYQEKPIAYNAPHLIHLDTAIFQNKRHTNLIEISSDSEDTTESEGSDSDSSDDESSDSESSDSESSGSDDHTENAEPTVEPEHSIIDEVVVELVNSVSATAHATAPETKMITVDLGAIKESSSTSPEHQPLDVLAMLYKKSDTHEEPDVVAPATSSVAQPLTGMSVTELRNLLKEKHPEKHAEIQKMKKAELIQSLQ